MKDPQGEAKVFDWAFKMRLKVYASVFLISLVCLFFFGGLGYLLDRWLNLTPVLTIVGLAISLPIRQVILYFLTRKFAQKTLSFSEEKPPHNLESEDPT